MQHRANPDDLRRNAPGTMRSGRPTGERHRKLLLGLVAANPGVHVRRAASLIGLNWNACRHHVRRLERDGRIVVRRHAGRLCLFERRQGAAAPRIARVVVLEPRNTALVGHVLEHPGRTQRGLARLLDLPASVVHRRLVQLESMGLVQRTVEPRARLVFPTDALAQVWGDRAGSADAVSALRGGAPSALGAGGWGHLAGPPGAGLAAAEGVRTD